MLCLSPSAREWELNVSKTSLHPKVKEGVQNSVTWNFFLLDNSIVKQKGKNYSLDAEDLLFHVLDTA